MKIVVAGGSGALGRRLCKDLAERGHEVVVLTRRMRPGPFRQVEWDGRTVGPWSAELEGSAVVNLAGELVDRRPTPANVDLLTRSRVEPTRALVAASRLLSAPVPVWIQASTLAIYGDAGDQVLDETAPVALAAPAVAQDEGGHATAEIAKQPWTFAGVFGTYDEHQLQRGFQIFREVCAGCHGLEYVAFRHLEALGFSEDQVRALASDPDAKIATLAKEALATRELVRRHRESATLASDAEPEVTELAPAPRERIPLFVRGHRTRTRRATYASVPP